MITTVLASYAVAAYPFTKRNILDYFEDYCRHYKIHATTTDSESQYLKDFKIRYAKPGMNGYKVIKDLHDNSTEISFKNARNKFDLQNVDNAENKIDYLENELKSEQGILVNVFINQSSLPNLASKHSITIGYDSLGFYIYDVNKGRALRGITSICEIGRIGSTFIIRKIGDKQ